MAETGEEEVEETLVSESWEEANEYVDPSLSESLSSEEEECESRSTSITSTTVAGEAVQLREGRVIPIDSARIAGDLLALALSSVICNLDLAAFRPWRILEMHTTSSSLVEGADQSVRVKTLAATVMNFGEIVTRRLEPEGDRAPIHAAHEMLCAMHAALIAVMGRESTVNVRVKVSVLYGANSGERLE